MNRHWLNSLPDRSAVHGVARNTSVVGMRLNKPFATGFLVVGGGLVVIALAMVFLSLSSVLMSITLSLFLALGMMPVINQLKKRGLSHLVSVLVVVVLFVLVVAGLLAAVIPALVRQFNDLIAGVPAALHAVQQTEWYSWISQQFGISVTDQALKAIENYVTAENLMAISGGILHVGFGVVNGISAGFLIVVLTLYFVSTLDSIKSALVRLIPAYRRPVFTSTLEDIIYTVGRSVAGSVTLSAINAGVVFVLFLLLGSKITILLAIAAFFISLIPMIGSVLFLFIGTFAGLLMGPSQAVVFALSYFIYIQLEAYQVTPRVMGKAVNVPGILVIIAAMAGAALMGLLGALLSIPVTASVLIIVRKLVVPKADSQTVAPSHNF